jgi:hypothetical protein
MLQRQRELDGADAALLRPSFDGLAPELVALFARAVPSKAHPKGALPVLADIPTIAPDQLDLAPAAGPVPMDIDVPMPPIQPAEDDDRRTSLEFGGMMPAPVDESISIAEQPSIVEPMPAVEGEEAAEMRTRQRPDYADDAQGGATIAAGEGGIKLSERSRKMLGFL